MDQDKDSVFWGIVIVIIFSIIYGVVAYNESGENLSCGVIAFFIGLIVHPVVGRLLYTVYYQLGRVVDRSFKLEGANSWQKRFDWYYLYCIALWPIAAPILIVVALVGAVLGLVMRV